MVICKLLHHLFAFFPLYFVKIFWRSPAMPSNFASPKKKIAAKIWQTNLQFTTLKEEPKVDHDQAIVIRSVVGSGNHHQVKRTQPNTATKTLV